MIFLTVGTQLPFDRLVRAVDRWAASSGRSDVFGQIADPGAAGFRPQHVEWVSFLSPTDFKRRFEQAECVIAHAGMGSIISALGLGKPILIMPRRADLREHRNDHQLATATRFGDKPGVFVAETEEEVPTAIEAMLAQAGAWSGSTISPFAQESLVAAVRGEIFRK